ncbi:PulJ/GspJ family protein [Piscinibacter terrae]|uniref:Prepilin-type N-terminal cleavage/methylation domain-containing protein n=1 Tax=Piscinibacter terrae TaxID=2496871 RepID=A0A3N7JVS0_9BURK|nr:prepilin-type N-terminal cleavage/methylation domain-containing protein [Albitalea terrae]RQP24959.1 prepilin-type N-terminal cleavage/methylation domain-containing protein [Albitalea terrae]
MLGPVTRQRGFTLVEVMVGLVVGLLVVVAAAALLATHLREHRSMLVEARLMQDLRTSTDIIVRDVRRSGYWGNARTALRPGMAASNPYVALSPASASAEAVSFQLSRDATENDTLDDNERFGFRLRHGVIEMLIGGGSWQALTDAGTLEVLSFQVSAESQVQSLRDACERPCDLAVAACGPVIEQRKLTIAITARAVVDHQVVRTLTSQARIRNDVVSGACLA